MENRLEKQIALLTQEIQRLETEVKSLKLTRKIHISELDDMHNEIKALKIKVDKTKERTENDESTR